MNWRKYFFKKTKESEQEQPYIEFRITATEARAIMSYSSKSVGDIMFDISDAAAAGQVACVQCNMAGRTIDELKNLGYRVRGESDGLNGEKRHSISWDKQ